MSRFYFDIETVADPALPQVLINRKLEVKADGRLSDPQKMIDDIVKKQKTVRDKFALSPLTGKMIGFVLTVDNVKGESASSVQSVFSDDEAFVLTRLRSGLGNFNDVFDEIVTFSQGDFDLRFTRIRLAVNGLKPIKLPFDRYDAGNRNIWSILNGEDWHSQDDWAMRFGLIDKYSEFTGADIGKMYLEGRLDQIEAKCKADIEKLQAIDRLLLFGKRTEPLPI